LPVPPYALSSAAFRFRALASLAGRAPLGGPREVALATYLVARLVDDCVPEKQLPATAREERSTAARGWLANIALPSPVRTALTKLAEATAHGTDIEPALASVIAATSSYLDAAARTELDRLARSFAK
jgi:phytoene/squalene synthetase